MPRRATLRDKISGGGAAIYQHRHAARPSVRLCHGGVLFFEDWIPHDYLLLIRRESMRGTCCLEIVEFFLLGILVLSVMWGVVWDSMST